MKASSPIRSRKRKFAFWLLALLAFYTVFGFLILPPIVRSGAVKQLSQQLGREVSIEKIKINPFAFSTEVRGLVIKEKDGQPFVSWDDVYVDFQITSLFKHAWTVQEISASKPFIRVEMKGDGTFNFSDILARFSTTNAVTVKPATAPKPLAVELLRLHVDGAELVVKRDKPLATTNAVEIPPPLPATNAPDPVVALLQSVTNAVTMLLQSTNQLGGVIDGITLTNCVLHFEDDMNSRPATLDLSDVTLDARNISNLADTNLTAQLALRWNTNGSIKVAADIALRPLAADVQLDLDQLDLGTLDPYLEPNLDLYILGSEVGLHAKITVRAAENGLPQIAFQGDAALDGFHTVDGVMGEDLLKWDSLRINGIDARFNPESADIKEIRVDNAYARLVIETNKTINLLNVLRITSASTPDTNEIKVAVAQTSGVTNSPLPPISVGVIVISNTAASFTDRSVSPNVNMKVQDANGTISGISSAEMQHAILDLGANVDGVGPVAITGTINPLNGLATNEIKISVKDVDLTPTSPYSGKFAGYRIAEGKLNLDLVYEITGKKLESKNVITLDRFTFGEKVASPDATHLPVQLAIAILKDRDGKIILDVPIQGSLADPKFRIGKVVQRALLNILEKAATSPFSLLGAAFGGGGEELGWQDFAAGGAELTADDTNKLAVLSKALYDRPGLNLEIAGSIDPAGDREGLQRTELDRQIRERVWMKSRKSQQAAGSAAQITLTPEERADWVKKFYDEALADGKITPELIAANTNLAAIAAQILPRKILDEKGATKLFKPLPQNPQASSAPAYRTKLVPPPSPVEALLLATIPVGDADFDALAAARAKVVEDYLLQNGKVAASRLFLTEKGAVLRSDGSRVYFQLR